MRKGRESIEIWKPIVGYEKYYQVSNWGRIKSLPRTVVKSDGVVQYRKERIKRLTKNSDGYLMVGLSMNGKTVKKSVHILVAEAFVDGKFDGAEVNHIDFDRTNNKCENLEWVSHRDNIYHTIAAQRHVCQRNINGSLNPNYGNHKLHDKYIQDKQYALEKQSRPGCKNGRATPVDALFPDGERLHFGYYKECAEYLVNKGIVVGKSVAYVGAQISNAVRNNAPYYGIRFIKQ